MHIPGYVFTKLPPNWLPLEEDHNFILFYISGQNITYYLDGSCTQDVEKLVETSNMAIPGKWIFRLDGEQIESSECNSEKYISEPLLINPNFVSIFGRVPIEFSGPCVNQSSNISITFFDDVKGITLI